MESDSHDEQKPPSTRRRRWLWAVVRLSVLYVLLCAGLYFAQYRLLYQPARMSAAEVAETIADSGLVQWPAGAGEYRGFLAEPEEAAARGTIVLFHGNAGDALDREFFVPHFRALGWRVLLLEYPGYGARGGEVGEESIVADGAESLRLAVDEFGAPLIVIGESLGAGVAAAVVARAPEGVGGVALFTPWDTLPNLAAQRFWFLPARLLVADRYDTITNLEAFTGKIAIIIAEHDEVIPRALSEALRDALPGDPKLFVIEGRRHNTWPMDFDRKLARRVLEAVTPAE